jgi:transcriptional regulator with XRE-family HTH domain
VSGEELSGDVAASFGPKLRKAREKAEMSQERLGHLSSTDRSEIGRLEKGIRVPRLDTIIRLAGALGVEPCELMADVRWTPPSETEGRYRDV